MRRRISSPAGYKVGNLSLESLIGEVTVVEVPSDVMSIDADFVSNQL